MGSALKLIAATPDMRELLVAALDEHGIAWRGKGRSVIIDGLPGEDSGGVSTPDKVIALLRECFSTPERAALSVLEEPESPDDFPVATSLEAWWSGFETPWFERAIRDEGFSVWFQPVVDTTARRTIGHECLLRLSKGRRRNGAEILTAASARGDLRGFDAYARRLALRSIAGQGRSRGLCFINFIPSALYRPDFCLRETVREMEGLGIPPERLVFEAVQSSRNPDLAHLRRIADYLSQRNIGFALDDLGANAEAVRLVCDLRPDYVKLEKQVLNHLELPRETAALRRIVEVAERLRVRVIAKNVERVATMEHLWAAGIQCMQGHLFGSPVPEMTGTAMDLARLARAIEPSADASGCEIALADQETQLV